ncbi:MAG: hypothetical protein R3181_06525, partial [Rubricoccaceae bacterium]|nr:hypothetical protein [Rubricoccaceae bacterium]
MKGYSFSFILGALLVVAMAVPATQAQEFFPPDGEESSIPICFIDDFAYVWNLNLVGGSVTGTVNTGSPPDWIASGSGNRTSARLRADNPNADGCASGFTDYFTYDCSVTPLGGGTFQLSCTWESFCAGVLAGSGTVNGTATRGACRAAPPAPGTDGPAMSPQVQASATLAGADAVSTYPNP